MKHETDHTYTLVLNVYNNPGMLVRCAQIFNRRGHNIEALQVIPMPESPMRSLMKITAFGDAKATEQITLQLQKLVDVKDIYEER
jgi:acetolactate synthase I/III small subunit